MPFRYGPLFGVSPFVVGPCFAAVPAGSIAIVAFLEFD